MNPMIQLVNLGSAIDLRKLRIRYWFKDETKAQGYDPATEYNYSLSYARAYEGVYINDATPIPNVIESNGGTYKNFNVKEFARIQMTPVANAGLQDMAFDITFDWTMDDKLAILDTQHITKIELSWVASIQNPHQDGYYINQGNDWSYAANYPDATANPAYVSNPLVTGLITAYYDGKIIYGQEPVHMGSYEEHVDCGGYGKTAANGKVYRQDQVYGVGGWGLNTFSYYYDYYSSYYQNFYNTYYYGYNSYYTWNFSYYYNKSFAGTGSDTPIYQNLLRNNGGGVSITQGYLGYPTQYIFDNVPNGTYEVTLNFITPNDDSINDFSIVSLNRHFALQAYYPYSDTQAVGVPHSKTVIGYVWDGRLDIRFWNLRYFYKGQYGQWVGTSPDGSLASFDVKLVTYAGTSRKWEPGRSVPPPTYYWNYYYYGDYYNNYDYYPWGNNPDFTGQDYGWYNYYWNDPSLMPAEIIPDTCSY